MKRVDKVLNHIYYVFEKHWLWNLAIKALVALWFTLYQTKIGEFFKITNSDGSITWFGVGVTIFVHFLFAVIVVSEVYYSRRGESKEINTLRAENFILKEVEESLQSVANCKAETLRSLVGKYISQGSSASIPAIVSNPEKQISKILEKCVKCFLDILNADQKRIDFKDVSYSLIYRFNNDWKIISPNGIELPSIIGTDCSTFDYMINSEKLSKFINRKEKGIEDGEYKATRRDIDCKENGDVMGSIFCRSFKISHSQGGIADAILAISTYGNYFVPSDKENEKRIFRSNIEEYIFKGFENQLKLELKLLWLKEH